MTAPTATDPVPATARTGSWRPGALVVLVIAVLAGALVRGLLLESYHVPTAGYAPVLEPGDRVLVLKTDHHVDAGETGLVDEGGALHLESSTEAAATRADVVGTVLWRFWPLDRMGSVGTIPAPGLP
ncbi:hypothetical protein [Arthrobacter sp. NEB 688]|uniref:hypothetical protein n=1 Tax=Arthrobacter sp. NEB 688 TaxID=904039 RepID=UPI00156302F3|nr:hypothetical protein [Arthrobacter sp. NEB 688]QKE84256.1 hypothetical protein HL663_10100 [Arthrobacter sp. NEB 688]